MKNITKKLSSWFKRLFYGPQKELSIFEEEQMQSPMRTIASNFYHNKLAMTAVIGFIIILLFVTLGPLFFPIYLGANDVTQVNTGPGLSMLSVPKELKADLKKISSSSRFGVGISNEGKVYTWGKTRISQTTDISNIPKSLEREKVIDIAAGLDHVVAYTESGKLVFWGSNRNNQADVPMAVESLGKGEIKQLVAGNQATAVVTQDGKLFIWGNEFVFDTGIKPEYQGQFEKIAMASYSYIALLKDGSVVYPGATDKAYKRIPESLSEGVVDIAATSSGCAAAKADGSVVVWGNTLDGENILPNFDGKIVSIFGGRYSFTALSDKGTVYTWGKEDNGVTKVPKAAASQNTTEIFGGYFQNYAVTSDGEVHTWGLKGFLLGTDELGRDILTRIINGGKMTMTVGGVAVVISVLIGVVLGSLAGYFGGKIDILIMRLAEIVGGLPFLPFAMILSAIVGSLLTESQRIYLIMVILGVLSWPGLANLVRAQVFSARESEYVTAAKAVGLREGKILFRHILPNVISIVVVSATLSFATSMLTESTLSYLGFGVSLPTPTWGNMLTGANNSVVIQQYWWRWVFVSIIFGICTICINTIGDGLRDAIDPKSNKR